jgi:hypothetical protein
MTVPADGHPAHVSAESSGFPVVRGALSSDLPMARELAPLLMLDEADGPNADPGTVILTCANCGAAMDERKCKLICRCGYFLSCSDYS